MEENTVRQDFTNSEIHAIQKYFHETESRMPGPKKDEEKILSDSDRNNEPPINKTAKATDKSIATVSKISQVMGAESEDPGVQIILFSVYRIREKERSLA